MSRRCLGACPKTFRPALKRPGRVRKFGTSCHSIKHHASVNADNLAAAGCFSLSLSLSLSLPLSPSVSLCPALTWSETRSLCLDPRAATPLHLESSLACNCLPATTLRCCVLPVSVWVCPTLSWFTTRSLCFGLACKSTFLPRSCVCLQLRCYYSGLPFSVSVCLAFSWPRG